MSNSVWVYAKTELGQPLTLIKSVLRGTDSCTSANQVPSMMTTFVPFKYNTSNQDIQTPHTLSNYRGLFSEDSILNQFVTTSHKSFMFCIYYPTRHKTRTWNMLVSQLQLNVTDQLSMICEPNQNNSVLYRDHVTCLFVWEKTGARVCRLTNKAMTTTKRACGTKWQTLTCPVLWRHDKGSERRMTRQSYSNMTQVIHIEFPSTVQQAGTHCRVMHSRTS